MKKIIWCLVAPLPYAAAFLPVYVLGYLITGGFVGLLALYATPTETERLYIIANVWPVLVISLGLYLALAILIQRFVIRTKGLLGHLQRCSLLYAAAAYATWVLISTKDNHDYWMYMQLFLWAALVGGAGIVSDLVVWPLRRLYERATHRAV